MQALRTDREFAYLGRKWNETSGPSYDIDVRLGVNLVVLTAPRGLPIFAEQPTISKASRRVPKVR
ncbi:hypothetical protein V1289_003905 [Bradyrhizobium sp. AZCC 2289]